MSKDQRYRNRVQVIYGFDQHKTSYQISSGFYQGAHHFKGQFNDFRFLILLKGRGTFIQQNKSYPLIPGSIVLRASDQVHEIRRQADEPWLEYFLVLPKFLEALLYQLFVLQAPLVFTSHPKPEILGHFIRAHHEEFYQTHFYSHPSFLSWLFKLAHQLYFAEQTKKEASISGKSTNQTKANSRQFIFEAQSLIQQQLYQKINLKDLSSSLGMSFDLFRKKFTTEIGVSPKAYWINSKIARAQEILSTENIKVQELAARLAYPDAFSFSKQFKARTGFSPKDYREKTRA